MALTSRKNEINRLEIVEAARDLILERGFNSVTLQEILSAAQITKGKFFHYFDSKDECFTEVLKQALSGREFLRFEEVLAKQKFASSFDGLMYILDQAIEWHAKGLPSSLQLCVLSTFFFPKSSPEMVRARTLLLANLKTVENLFRACQEEKSLPESLSPRALAYMMPGSGIGGNIVGFFSEGKGRAVECLRELKTLLLELKK